MEVRDQIRVEACRGTKEDPLWIGRRGEKIVRTAVFTSLPDLREIYGPGSWAIVVERPTEEGLSYQATETWESSEGYACWDLTDADVGIAGYGKVELRYYPDGASERIYKTQVYITKIDESINGNGDGSVPLPYEDYMERLIVIKREIDDFIEDYEPDVFEYSSISEFPATGESGKIYVDTSANATYRWSGTDYVAIGSSLALGETSTTAYRGDRGKIAYDYAVGTHSYNDLTDKPTIIKWIKDSDGPDANTTIQSIIENNLTSNIASGRYSHAEGSNTTASGTESHAEGYGTQALGYQSHAEGCNSVAGIAQVQKYSAHAEGHTTHAEGEGAHSEGKQTYAANDQAHAEGLMTTAFGAASHAEGYNTITGSISSQYSGTYAHAEGNTTTASGASAHAEGYQTRASGIYSHAEGYNTVASGGCSHSGGQNSTASGNTAYTSGIGTIANHKSQFTFGEYNTADDSTAAATSRGNYIEIVGNGTSTSARSNARTLDWSGNEVLAGKLTVGAGPTNSMDVATKQYVDTLIGGLGPLTGELVTQEDISDHITLANFGSGKAVKYVFGGHFVLLQIERWDYTPSINTSGGVYLTDALDDGVYYSGLGGTYYISGYPHITINSETAGGRLTMTTGSTTYPSVAAFKVFLVGWKD